MFKDVRKRQRWMLAMPRYTPSKYPKSYTTMISGEKKITPKKAYILSKLKLRQMVVISKVYTKINNFDKLLYKYLVNTLLKLKK